MFGAYRIGLQLQHLDSIVVSRYLKKYSAGFGSRQLFTWFSLCSDNFHILFCDWFQAKTRLAKHHFTNQKAQPKPTNFVPGSSLFLFPRGGGMKRTLGAKCIFPSEEEKRVRYFM